MQEAIMTVTAYSQTAQGGASLQLNNPTVIIQLRLPNTGTFVIWGKVVLENLPPLGENPASIVGSVSMTTLDGATTLDTANIAMGPTGATPPQPLQNTICVPLQSTLNLSQPNVNEIVDIRCVISVAAGQMAAASWASLIAIPVDALSGPVAPPS
jgi:hypothetical protein